MSRKIKKKKDREERKRQERIRKSQMDDYSDSAMKKGRAGLYLIGMIILVASVFVFVNMR